MISHSLRNHSSIMMSLEETFLNISCEKRKETTFQIVPDVSGAFVIRDLLSISECKQLQSAVEGLHSQGEFLREESSLQRRSSQHHESCRVSEESMYNISCRLHDYLPKSANVAAAEASSSSGGNNGNYKYRYSLDECGKTISPYLRCYQYKTGEFSTPHYDTPGLQHEIDTNGIKNGTVIRMSAFTLLLYLNADFIGGETTFFETDPNTKISRSGKTPVTTATSQPLKILAQIRPNGPGDALVFPHGTFLYPNCYPSPLHEGTRVEQGEKFLIRSDIMYCRMKNED